MKTLDTLYQQILSDDALKASFAEAANDKDALAAWLKAQGCEATPEDVQNFVQAKSAKSGELSDDELSSAAGGCRLDNCPTISYSGSDKGSVDTTPLVACL